MGLILTIIIGGIVGWLASVVMKTNAKQNLLMDVGIGIAGGFIGGLIATLLGFGGSDSLIVQIIIGLAGACALIFGLKKFGKM